MTNPGRSPQFLPYTTQPLAFTLWQGKFPARRQSCRCRQGLLRTRSQRCPPADLQLSVCPRLLPIWPREQ